MNYRVVSYILIPVIIVLAAGTVYTSRGKGQGKTYRIGERGPAGGWVFYDKGEYSDGWRYLEAAPEDRGRAKWGCYAQSVSRARGTAIGTGKSNTLAIVENCKEDDIAPKLCILYRGGGVNDWFLPSKEELNLMYINLKEKGIAGFDDYFYWSSSEHSSYYAWDQDFSKGYREDSYKELRLRVRPIRAF